jgi:hypothetical protein
MKTKLLLLSAAIMLSTTASAALNGPDNMPWKASADTPNTSAHSGIVVTDSTYAQCVTQFQNAMTNHAYYHGDTFTNIQYCHYNPASGVAGGYYELQLAVELADLETDYNITEYLQKKEAVLKEYYKKVEVLPDAPRETRK